MGLRLPAGGLFIFFVNLSCASIKRGDQDGRKEKPSIVNVGFQVLPKTSDGVDSYAVVDEAIAVVSRSGVKYEVGAMETVMEGELDELLDIVKEAQQACIRAGAKEVMTFVKIHYRPEGVTMDEKLEKYR